MFTDWMAGKKKGAEQEKLIEVSGIILHYQLKKEGYR